MIIRNISNAIQETLKARERALSRKRPNPNVGVIEGTLQYGDLASRSTFITMASANGLPDQRRLIQGGEVINRTEFGFDSEGFEGAYEEQGTGPGGEGFRPLSGIIDCEVSYKGGYKAIREATVNWVANSFNDLDDLTPNFLTIGKSVLLEFGWVFPNEKLNRKISENSFIVKEDKSFVFHNDIFEDPQSRIEAAGGNFDAIFGVISNFDYQLNESGGFNCTTKIISTGVNMFDSQKAKGTESPNVKTTPEGSNSALQSKISQDGLIPAILNIEKIIFNKIANIPAVEIGNSGVSSFTDIIERGIRDGAYKSLFDKDIVRIMRNGFSKTNSLKNNVILSIGKETKAVFSNLEISYDQPIGRQKSEDFFVSYGWLEDNIFSRYLSYTSPKTNEILNTIRSVEPERDGFGNPLINFKPAPNGAEITLNSNGDYVYQVKEAGQEKTVIIPPEKYSELLIPVDDESAFSKYKNRSVLIRCHPNLLPIDPLRFFLPGLNPKSERFSYPSVPSGEKLKEVKEHIENLLKANSNKSDKFIDERYGEFSYGRLRKVMINTKELKRAFGIDVGKTFSSFTQKIFAGEVRPPKNMKDGIMALLKNLNANFHNYWDFQIVQDTLNNGNMKVVDTKSTPEFDNKIYSKFAENSHKIEKRGIFKFPAFTLGSIVKTQDLSFKIPDSMAISAMYGSNQNKRAGIAVDQTNDNSVIQAVFSNDTGNRFEDFRFSGMERAFVVASAKEGATGHKIGAHNTSEKIRFGGSEFSIDIGNDETKYWSTFGNESNEVNDVNHNFFQKIGAIFSSEKEEVEVSEFDKQLNEFEANLSKFSEQIRLVLGNKKSVVKELEEEIDKISEQYPDFNNMPESVKEKYIALGSELDEVENTNKVLTPYVLTPATNGSNNVEGGLQLSLYAAARTIVQDKIYKFSKTESAYLANYLIPAELNLTIDGVSGILPGEVIQTDYIQAKYNTSIINDDKDIGPFAFFQIFGLDQKISKDGWETSITTKMRVNSNVLEMNAADVVRFIRDKVRESKDTEQLPVTFIPGQNNLITGANYTPEGNFDGSRGIANRFNSFVIGGKSFTLNTNKVQKNTYDILKLQTPNTLVRPKLSPVERADNTNALFVSDRPTNPLQIKRGPTGEGYNLSDIDINPVSNGQSDFIFETQRNARLRDENNLTVEQEQTQKEMKELEIKEGTIINEQTIEKTNEEKGDDIIDLTPVVTEQVPNVNVESKDLEDSANPGDGGENNASEQKIVVNKDLDKKLDSSIKETAGDAEVSAVQESVGATNKTTKYTTVRTAFDANTLRYIRKLDATGRGYEVDMLINMPWGGGQIATLRDPNLITIIEHKGKNYKVFETPPQTELTSTPEIEEVSSGDEKVSEGEQTERLLEKGTKQPSIINNIKAANREENKIISKEIKEKKPEIVKVSVVVPKFRSSYVSGTDQNNYLYEIVPGWRTEGAGGVRTEEVSLEYRRKFWDEMIEPQKDINIAPTGKMQFDYPKNVYGSLSGIIIETPDNAQSVESFAQQALSDLKGKFEDSRTDGDGKDVTWNPIYPRPNTNGNV